MKHAHHLLIKFLARIAVDQYLAELQQHEKLLPKEIEQQSHASSCPEEISSNTPHQKMDSAEKT